jgi:phenylacetate-CoA ligase
LSARDQQHIVEDHFYWEVIDPDTGEVLPEGTPGELVLTPLNKQAFPVLRYRTHDLTAVSTKPCECGRTTARMNKVRSRSDDMLIIRGTNVFPSQFEDVLHAIPGASPHYRLIVDNQSGMDRLTLELELASDSFTDSFQELEAFRRRIQERLYSVLQVGTEVKLVEPGRIERAMGKTKHVLDLRR